MQDQTEHSKMLISFGGWMNNCNKDWHNCGLLSQTETSLFFFLTILVPTQNCRFVIHSVAQLRQIIVSTRSSCNHTCHAGSKVHVNICYYQAHFGNIVLGTWKLLYLDQCLQLSRKFLKIARVWSLRLGMMSNARVQPISPIVRLLLMASKSTTIRPKYELRSRWASRSRLDVWSQSCDLIVPYCTYKSVGFADWVESTSRSSLRHFGSLSILYGSHAGSTIFTSQSALAPSCPRAVWSRASLINAKSASTHRIKIPKT